MRAGVFSWHQCCFRGFRSGSSQLALNVARYFVNSDFGRTQPSETLWHEWDLPIANSDDCLAIFLPRHLFFQYRQSGAGQHDERSQPLPSPDLFSQEKHG